MNPISFDFGNAISHFSKTGGPAGFIWKFALGYALISCLVQGFSVWLQWPLYETYIEMFASGGDFETYAEDISRVSAATSLKGMLMLPLTVLVWVMFEGASQRRYMRGDGFRLRIGADEGRIFVVGLIWMALLFAMYFAFAIAILIPVVIGLALGSNGAIFAVLLGIVIVPAVMVLALWIFARLSAATALTVRDQKIRFSSSWRVTKGKGWTILGAWIVLMLIALVAVIVFYVIAAALGLGIVSSQVPDLLDGRGSEAEVLAAVASPVFWIPMLLILLAFLLFQSSLMHIFGGPAALAARTDPEWIGADVAGEFQ